MASRPFASVAVALEVGGDQEELLQVSKTTKTRHTERRTQTHEGNDFVVVRKKRTTQSPRAA